MDTLASGLIEGLRLLVTGDREIWAVTLLSLRVSLTTTLLCLLLGIPLGMALALTRFPGRSMFISLINTGTYVLSPPSGTNPNFVLGSGTTWSGTGTGMNSLTYGLTKGYNSTRP